MIRALLFSGLLLLVACDDGAAEGEAKSVAAASESAGSGGGPGRAEDAGRIECAIAGAAFERSCTVERANGDEGLVLTIRAPSGSFRRLLVTKDGRGVVAADGAMPAVVSPLGSELIEVKIAADRYRLPARVGQSGPPNPAR